MKTLIFAAGVGTRMLPLTKDLPKPMLTLLGKPLLQYIFESLPEEIDEIILVVGYKREAIENYFGDSFYGKKISYVVQKKPTGTAGALDLCRPHLNNGERFLLLYADDIFDKESIGRCLRHPLSLIVAEVDDPRRYGVVQIDENGLVTDLEEKPEVPKSKIVAPGVYVLDTQIFSYKPSKNQNGEYYFTTMLGQMIKKHPIHTEKINLWLTFAHPEDLIKAEKIMLSNGGNVISGNPL